MSKSIFISHAVADKALVEAFTDFLMEGMGVPESEIFCSSLEGMGIPTGRNFVEHIRQQIEKPKLMILMLTPSYRASLFCIAEMGAAWAMIHDIFPIIVPPLGHKDIDGVLLGTQVRKIEDDLGLPNELRERLGQIVTLQEVTPTRWDQKRKAFLAKLPAILAKLKTPITVDPKVHEELEARYATALSELEDLDRKAIALADQLAEVSKLKDKAEVYAITTPEEDEELVDRFEALIDDVKQSLAELGSTEVRRAVLADNYGQPYAIPQEYADDFTAAARRKVFTIDGEVNYNDRKVIAFTKAAGALKIFFDEHEYELTNHIDDKFHNAVEFDNEDFWNDHFL